MNSTPETFKIPESFIGRKVFIKMPIPIPDKMGNLGFPGFEAFIKEDLGGALLLVVDRVEVVYPKSKIWQIDKASDIAIATKMPPLQT